MTRSRWDFIYDLKPVAAGEALLDMVARMLGDEIDRWPPAIESWEDEAARRRFASLIEGRVGRPPPGPLRLALRLARWELLREVELVDRYMVGERWRDDAPGPYDYELAMFLWRYLVDQVLAFKEMTGARFRREELATIVDRLGRRFASTPAGATLTQT